MLQVRGENNREAKAERKRLLAEKAAKKAVWIIF
jgi:hypothetical protein